MSKFIINVVIVVVFGIVYSDDTVQWWHRVRVVNDYFDNFKTVFISFTICFILFFQCKCQWLNVVKDYVDAHFLEFLDKTASSQGAQVTYVFDLGKGSKISWKCCHLFFLIILFLGYNQRPLKRFKAALSALVAHRLRANTAALSGSRIKMLCKCVCPPPPLTADTSSPPAPLPPSTP